MKAFLLLALILPLQGCFFVFIPGSAVDALHDKVTGAEGHHCVSESAKVGDRINIPGQGVGIIKSLSGTSYKCTREQFPIRAMLEMQS